MVKNLKTILLMLLLPGFLSAQELTRLDLQQAYDLAKKNYPRVRQFVIKGAIKSGHFACGVLTPQATKGDVRPLWKLYNVVPASRSGIYVE